MKEYPLFPSPPFILLHSTSFLFCFVLFFFFIFVKLFWHLSPRLLKRGYSGMSGWAVCLSSIFLFSIILQGEGSPFPKDKFGVERGNNNDFNRFKNQRNTETRYFLIYVYNTYFSIFRILLLPRVKKTSWYKNTLSSWQTYDKTKINVKKDDVCID